MDVSNYKKLGQTRSLPIILLLMFISVMVFSFTCPHATGCTAQVSVTNELVSANPAYTGDTVTYQIEITNVGKTKLVKLPLDDYFEASNLNFLNATPTPDNYSEIAGTILWKNLTSLKPLQSITVILNFVATAGGNNVRESANVTNAEDTCGHLFSVGCVNTQLKIIQLYTLHVTASPSTAFGGTFQIIWTERGIKNNSTFSTPRNIICDNNTNATISNPENITNGNVRYAFNNYSVRSPTVKITSNMTVVLNYRTQYKIVFAQSGVGTDFNGTVATIDNVNYSVTTLPSSFWWDQNSTHSFAFQSPLTVTANTKQYVWKGTSGLSTSQNDTIWVSTSGSITGNYTTQWRVTFDQSGVGSDFVGTVVVIDNASYGVNDLPISFWYYEGSSHSFAFKSPLSVSSNKQYVWVSTTGLSTSENSSITASTSGNVTGNFKTQTIGPIVPEFPPTMILPLFMMATLLAATIHTRKKSKRARTWN
jgi:hypothetical protein